MKTVEEITSGNIKLSVSMIESLAAETKEEHELILLYKKVILEEIEKVHQQFAWSISRI